MKIDVDQPVLDLLTGQQQTIEGQPATLRGLIIRTGSSPSPQDPDDPASAAKAWEIAVRAAALPKGGQLELSVDEASFLKARAFKVLFIQFAGPIHSAIEDAAA